AFVILMPFVLIFVSYGLTISSILKIKSTKGRYKAFSTCFSHHCSDIILWDSCVHLHTPKIQLLPDVNKVLSLFYSVVTPVLNPVIYSLRNGEVK
ncbi:OR2A5 protein, partial [Pardalotus punctatus]|nr:OR2A5 protein [Pardalotus punctatus]